MYCTAVTYLKQVKQQIVMLRLNLEFVKYLELT